MGPSGQVNHCMDAQVNTLAHEAHAPWHSVNQLSKSHHNAGGGRDCTKVSRRLRSNPRRAKAHSFRAQGLVAGVLLSQPFVHGERALSIALRCEQRCEGARTDRLVDHSSSLSRPWSRRGGGLGDSPIPLENLAHALSGRRARLIFASPGGAATRFESSIIEVLQGAIQHLGGHLPQLCTRSAQHVLP